MTAWQPIETAPKDGTEILSVRCSELGHLIYCVVRWEAEFELADWDDDALYRGAWTGDRVGSFNYEEYEEERPTHWMPLPAPPVQS